MISELWFVSPVSCRHFVILLSRVETATGPPRQAGSALGPDISIAARQNPSNPSKRLSHVCADTDPRVTIWTDAEISGAAARGRPWPALFWREGGNQFLEAQILAQWIKHWIQREHKHRQLLRPLNMGTGGEAKRREMV